MVSPLPVPFPLCPCREIWSEKAGNFSAGKYYPIAPHWDNRCDLEQTINHTAVIAMQSRRYSFFIVGYRSNDSTFT